jgi:hypothetical protein
MPDEQDRTASTDEVQANRGRGQGLGVGQREMDAQRDPNRLQTATNPEQRSFEGDAEQATNPDRPSQADFGDTDIAQDRRRAGASGEGGPPRRNAAGLDDVDGDLGAGTPANVDIHKLGQQDRPEQAWGEPAGEGATYSANHARRGTPAEFAQAHGRKTRQASKDQISRRK